MKAFVLNCSEIHSRYQLHEKIAEGLGFPEWYGRNLDALHDCLTEIAENTSFTLNDFSALEENLGGYAELLKKVLSHASKENEKLLIEIK